MYDIHSHILAGIDDGAKTIEDSVALCRMAHTDGVVAIVATPHIREGIWPNERGRITTHLEELRDELKRQEIPIEVVLGAEVYFATGIPEAIEQGAFPTYADRRQYMLLELPNHFIPRQVQDLIFELRTAGITPVLAHPERNPQVMAHLDVLEDIVRMGVLLQVTAMSITGRFGRNARKASDLLFARGLVHVIASDAHTTTSRPAILTGAREIIAHRHGASLAAELFEETPRRIIAGEEVEGGIREAPPARGGLLGLLSRLRS